MKNGIITLVILIFCSNADLLWSQQKISIKDAIRIALKNNPDIKVRKENIGAEKGRFLQSLSFPDPRLVLMYEGVPRGESVNNAEQRKIFFSQSFDFPTSYYYKNRIRSTSVDIRKAEFELSEKELVEKVKLAYLRVLSFREKMKMAEKNLELMEVFLEKAKLRYEVGEAAYLEFLQAKVKRGEAHNEVIYYKTEFTIALSNLKLLLFQDKNHNENLTLIDKLTFNVYDLSFERLLDYALGFNPERKISDLHYKMSGFNKKLAYNSFLPEMELSYIKIKIETNPDFWGLRLGASFPLWFLFNQRGEIQEARAHFRSKEWEKRNTEQQIRTDLYNGISKVRSMQSRVNLYRKEILREAEEVYRMAAKSYEEGEIGYIELIQAQQTLIAAQSGYIDSLLSYNTALVELEKIVGKELSDISAMEEKE